jgi:hypothetical protein
MPSLDSDKPDPARLSLADMPVRVHNQNASITARQILASHASSVVEGQDRVAIGPEAGCLGHYPRARLVRDSIRPLSLALPVPVEAPLNVETVITHDNPMRRYLVPLVSYAGLEDGNMQTNPGVQILGRSKLLPSAPVIEVRSLEQPWDRS